VKIRFSKSAARALLRSDKRKLIRRKIDDLAADPDAQAANVKKLHDRPESRLRVQDWRVIFRVDGEVLWIDEIAPRGSVY
jgi:mRNA-degrading endonuclease RelE of RelBE toxin-antitoxin system